MGRLQISLAGLTGTPFKKSKGVYQGQGSSPKVYSVDSERLAWLIFDKACAVRKLGVDFDGHLISRLTWADDNIIVARSARQLRLMACLLDNTLSSTPYTIAWTDEDKASWTANPAADDGEPLLVARQVVKRPASGAVRVLGKALCLDPYADTAIRHRIGSAWACFRSRSQALKLRDAGVGLRLRLLQSCVLPCLLWGLSSEALLDRHLTQIKRVQRSMTAKVLGLHRAPAEPWSSFWRRRRDRIASAVTAHKLVWWDDALLRRHWRLMGHVWRQGLTGPQRMASTLLNWSPIVQQMAESFLRGRAGHARPGRFRRVENRIHAFVAGRLYFDDWRELAADREAWAAQCSAFARSGGRGGATNRASRANRPSSDNSSSASTSGSS